MTANYYSYNSHGSHACVLPTILTFLLSLGCIFRSAWAGPRSTSASTKERYMQRGECTGRRQKTEPHEFVPSRRKCVSVCKWLPRTFLPFSREISSSVQNCFDRSWQKKHYPKMIIIHHTAMHYPVFSCVGHRVSKMFLETTAADELCGHTLKRA